MQNMLKNMHLILLKVFLYLIQILPKYFKKVKGDFSKF